MSKEQDNKETKISTIWKKIEDNLAKWVVGTIGVIICTGIPFYYNTNNTISAHTNSIHSISTEVNDIKEQVSSIKIDPLLNNEQIKAIQETVEDIRIRQQRLEARQDKMYDLMLEIANKK